MTVVLEGVERGGLFLLCARREKREAGTLFDDLYGGALDRGVFVRQRLSSDASPSGRWRASRRRA